MDLGNPAQGMKGKLYAHDVLLKDDFGVKPIVVDEGQWIHILLKSPQDTERSNAYYGHSGDPNERKKVEGQEFDDFEIKDSDFNTNYSYSSYGQVPYILYNKI